MTAEMMREATTTSDEVSKPRDASAAPRHTVRRPGALATQEQLDGIDRLIDAFEKEIGPVPPEIQEQFYADLAAADAEIGYVR